MKLNRAERLMVNNPVAVKPEVICGEDRKGRGGERPVLGDQVMGVHPGRGGHRARGETGRHSGVCMRTPSANCPPKKNRAYNNPVFLANLVEAAGVEPASANSPWKLLHA